MLLKACALCSCDIEHLEEPAVLFVGKYGRRYEICRDCETLMDTLVSPDSDEARNDAAKSVYHYLFNNDEQKSQELISFFNDLLSEDSAAMLEAQENLEEYEEEEKKKKEAEDEGDAPVTTPTEEDLPTEEEFLADQDKPLKLWAKLLFLLLFALLGGGAIAFGIIKSAVTMIVMGAIVLLVGIATLFSKD